VKKGDKPTNLDPAWWTSHKNKDQKEDSKLVSRLLFAHNHHIHYPKLDVNSKDDKVMRERVNMIRQLTAGLKEGKVAVENTIKLTKDADTKVALKHYLELMKLAEMDRQNWIKIERGVGNTANLQEMVIGPGLDKQIQF
jgi:hypothetical protein